jgi:hypothetical protein
MSSSAACNWPLKFKKRMSLSAMRKKNGITGTNVAAAVIFWPAIIGTYANANDAIKAAKARKEHLVALSTKKGCGS